MLVHQVTGRPHDATATTTTTTTTTINKTTLPLPPTATAPHGGPPPPPLTPTHPPTHPPAGPAPLVFVCAAPSSNAVQGQSRRALMTPSVMPVLAMPTVGDAGFGTEGGGVRRRAPGKKGGMGMGMSMGMPSQGSSQFSRSLGADAAMGVGMGRQRGGKQHSPPPRSASLAPEFDPYNVNNSVVKAKQERHQVALSSQQQQTFLPSMPRSVTIGIGQGQGGGGGGGGGGAGADGGNGAGSLRSHRPEFGGGAARREDGGLAFPSYRPEADAVATHLDSQPTMEEALGGPAETGAMADGAASFEDSLRPNAMTLDQEAGRGGRGWRAPDTKGAGGFDDDNELVRREAGESAANLGAMASAMQGEAYARMKAVKQRQWAAQDRDAAKQKKQSEAAKRARREEEEAARKEEEKAKQSAEMIQYWEAEYQKQGESLGTRGHVWASVGTCGHVWASVECWRCAC